ncbi:hypothetical protein ACIKT0_05905 [Hansschlegelia beijingensis]|uniref:hypothetical protein n=1 Tax=Hansschlegelia beijingensis TaxID=1133344 RepID=UPI00387EF593
MILNLLRRKAPRTAERVCYLHIGPHKTGSTSIQHALYVNAKRLARLGLYYPTTLSPEGRRRRNHSPLARKTYLRLPGELRDAPAWSEFSALLEKTPGSIVVSSEHFAILLRRDRWFERIIGFFEEHGFRVVIVAFVRDQPIWMNSWYTQDQKNFASRRSFTEFEAHVIKRGYMDPWAFLKRAMDHPRITVRPISFERAVKQGLARSVLDVIGVPASFKLEEPPRINPNFGVKGMFAAQEIMRRVDVRIRSLPNYIDLYEHFLKLMEGRNWEAQPYVGLTQEGYRAIRERFAPANEAFAQAYFGVPWTELCPERRYEPSVFDFETASAADRADVLEVIEEMVARVQESPKASAA